MKLLRNILEKPKKTRTDLYELVESLDWLQMIVKIR